MAAADGFSFTHVGVLPGEQASEVLSLNDARTLAGCASSHFEEQDVHPYTRRNAARWTPAGGLKALPLLPSSAAASNGVRSTFVGGYDVTPDGTKLLFSSHTTPEDGAAAAVCNADGSNVVVLTNLPGGDIMPTARQISDDGKTVFGRTYPADFTLYQASRWTAAGGFQLLAQPAGYNFSAPALGAISRDGSISAGTMATFGENADYIRKQAYRWTSGGGMKGIGYLPGDDRSSTVSMSADGSTILGFSSHSTDTYPRDTLFIWTAGGGMLNIGVPSETYSGNFFLSGSGLSADGNVAAVAYFNYYSGDFSREYITYLINPANHYYLDLIEAIKQAGGGSAIEGWTSFNANGITDDGNTVFGHATSPQNVREGFIAHFPAGFLQNLKNPERLLNISTRLQVGTGDKVSIAGFIVTGEAPKKVTCAGWGRP